MAFSNNLSISCFLLFLLPCIAKAALNPKSVVIPVTKDASTLKHITYITNGKPLTEIKVLVDLASHNLWVDCEKAYDNSSTYKYIECDSPKCMLAYYKACRDGCYPKVVPRCISQTCSHLVYNPFTNQTSSEGGLVSGDFIFKIGQVATSKNFLFACVQNWYAQGLPSGVRGMLGLGRTDTALPTQIAKAFKFTRKFAICLSSSIKSKGAIVFGDGSFNHKSKNLFTTPLITFIFGFLYDRDSEYYIGVKSLKINGKALRLNTTLLSISDEGYFGTKISTTIPYTILEKSIYRAVSEGFVKQLKNATRVGAVKPFGLCFSAKSIGSLQNVPPIDLVLQNNVYWRISRANSMVLVNKNVVCLGFVDGGLIDQEFKVSPSAITIGTHQIEDNLLQFDLAKGTLSLSSLVYKKKLSKCNDFNLP